MYSVDLCSAAPPAPVAQLDRAPGYEPGGLEVRTLSGAMFIIKAFPSGPVETNAYVVACQETKQAAIVDPAPGSFKPIVNYIEQQELVPAKILITHSHWDHIADVSPLKHKYSIPVLAHPLDAPNLQSPGADQLRCWVEIEGVVPDHLYEEGDHVLVGNLDFVVIHTPGHSPGGVCLYDEKQKILLSGDTIFRGTIGSLSLPTAQPELMWLSLKKLASLPSDVTFYPGHGSKSTIGRETWLSRAQEVFGE